MKRLINEIVEFGNDMTRHNAPSFSSSIAFFFFLSIFPSLMFLCSLIPYLPVTETDLVNFVCNFIPSALGDTIRININYIYSASSSFVPITAIATLWTAGMGIMGLIRGLNGILDIEDHRNYFVIRGIATVYTLLMLFVVIISMLLVGFGHVIYSYIINIIPQFSDFLSILLKLRSLVVIILMVIVFDFAYSFLPANRQKMLFQLPGAILASVGWWVITLAYSIYIEYFHGFSIYGNMIAIIAILFWFYAGFTLIIFGAFFNKYYNKQFNKRYTLYKNKREVRKVNKKEANKDNEINED